LIAKLSGTAKSKKKEESDSDSCGEHEPSCSNTVKEEVQTEEDHQCDIWVRQYYLLPANKMSQLSAHKINLTKAITAWETVKDVVKDLATKDQDSDAQEAFTNQSRVDDAIAAVESTILSLSVRLHEVQTLIDSNQLMSLPDNTQSVPERTQEHHGSIRRRRLQRAMSSVLMYCPSVQPTRLARHRTTRNIIP
ncbi:hypothetical protein OSTOST_19524, partial [Ostertagia ostertagi]